MTPLFKKLNWKDHRVIHVLEAPAAFEAALAALDGVDIRRAVGGRDAVTFGIAFAVTQRQLDAASRLLTSRADGDAIVWIAYPKGTSKRYRCEFNRDSGFAVLGAAGFEGVRQVAIDADWSALRFRRVTFIKSRARRAGAPAPTPTPRRRLPRPGR
jgi:hypothetical protein